MTYNYDFFAGRNDMIALFGLATKSPLTSLRLACCGGFRPSQAETLKQHRHSPLEILKNNK